jgi:hypothetical protein
LDITASYGIALDRYLFASTWKKILSEDLALWKLHRVLLGTYGKKGMISSSKSRNPPWAGGGFDSKVIFCYINRK